MKRRLDEWRPYVALWVMWMASVAVAACACLPPVAVPPTHASPPGPCVDIVLSGQAGAWCPNDRITKLIERAEKCPADAGPTAP